MWDPFDYEMQMAWVQHRRSDFVDDLPINGFVPGEVVRGPMMRFASNTVWGVADFGVATKIASNAGKITLFVPRLTAQKYFPIGRVYFDFEIIGLTKGGRQKVGVARFQANNNGPKVIRWSHDKVELQGARDMTTNQNYPVETKIPSDNLLVIIQFTDDTFFNFDLPTSS